MCERYVPVLECVCVAECVAVFESIIECVVVIRYVIDICKETQTDVER